MRIVLAAVALMSFTACLSLDGFLYTTQRLDSYEFKAEGDNPEETVSADRIEPLELKVDEDTMGAVYVRSSQQPPTAYVLYFQGQGGNIETSFPRIKRLANLGYDVLAIDYRGWGASTNIAPNEESVQRDAVEAQKFLMTRAQPGKVVYYGRSFGAAVATYLATQAAPQALILESPFASIQAMIEDSSSLPLPRELLSNSSWDNEARVAEMTVPLLLLHRNKDDYVRYEFSEMIYAAANEPKKFVTAEGADHGDVPEKLGPAYGAEIQSWVNAYVK